MSLNAVFGMVYLYDWKHYPFYSIMLYDTVPTSDQIYAQDVQLSVKIHQDEYGAVVGYVGVDELIDITDVIAHITLEGTIIVWGPDSDANGIWMVVFPYNTKISHVSVDTYPVDVAPMPEAKPTFGSTNVHWQNTDRPNHWFHIVGSGRVQSRVSVDAKYSVSIGDDNIPYTDTTYWAQNISRYDHKRHSPKFVASGQTISPFNTVKPPVVSSSELRHQIDRACWLITLLKRKYNYEPATFDNFRRKTYIP